MPGEIEFLYDFGSPASYLAHCGLKGVAERTGATVDHVPILLGAVLKATGNAGPLACPAKARYLFADLMRFAARDGVPMAINPHFPTNTVRLMRLATALRGDAAYPRFVDLAFAAMWHRPRDLGDADEVAALVADAGLDAAATLARAESPAVKDELRRVTDAAVARGVFGAPTFFVRGAMWFGQDRLDWVEAAAA